MRRASRMSRIDHDLFGLGGNSLEAEPRADDSFVHRAARGERRLLAVVGDGNAERPRVLERRAHEMRARDRLAVVADRDGAGAHHLAEFGERLPLLADGDRADRIDARARCARCACRTMNPTAAWLSVTGSVLGIAQTAVNPPAAAARAPVAIVSTSSRPGSRRWQCTSMNPGRDDRARAVDDLETSVAAHVA